MTVSVAGMMERTNPGVKRIARGGFSCERQRDGTRKAG